MPQTRSKIVSTIFTTRVHVPLPERTYSHASAHLLSCGRPSAGVLFGRLHRRASHCVRNWDHAYTHCHLLPGLLLHPIRRNDGAVRRSLQMPRTGKQRGHGRLQHECGYVRRSRWRRHRADPWYHADRGGELRLAYQVNTGPSADRNLGLAHTVAYVDVSVRAAFQFLHAPHVLGSPGALLPTDGRAPARMLIFSDHGNTVFSV
jgi:hypothetical protein